MTQKSFFNSRWLPALFMLLMIAGFNMASCTKKTKDKTIRERIVGHWKMDFAVYDDNKNNIRDVTDGIEYYDTLGILFNLDSNGTGFSADAFGSNPFAWKLVDNDTYLEITDSFATYHYQFYSVTDKNLTIRDTSTTPPAWVTYIRQ